MQPTSIGPFEVIRELGRGGMGVVFLARDKRLDRLVAIKSLPDHLVSDPDRLARFQREAKVLASLNHPAISAIYGVEEAADQQYLIIEYVEGQTLSARLEDGALQTQEALDIARHIAEALEAAHEKGVVHRDLKPGNVMITADSAIKLLDFGVARMQDADASAPVSPNTPMITSPTPGQSPTLPGAVVGSSGYMSPEQALGKPIDKRSDIFAFGCVLYEMLAGSRAFSGENETAALGALLHLEPDWSRLRATTPARIRDLLKSLTAKDRRNRLHDIGDARLTIERSLHAREWHFAPNGTGQRRGHVIARILPWAIVVGSIAVAAAAMWRPPMNHTTAFVAPVRLRIDDAESPLWAVSDTAGLAISADGKQVAYQTRTPGQPYFTAIRRTDDFSLQRFHGGSTDMYFGPDESLVILDGRSIFVRPKGGGDLMPVYQGTQYVSSKGCAWSPQGIVVALSPNSGLAVVSDKGEIRTLTKPDPSRNEISHRWPDVLPDGRRALITIKKADILTFDDAEIALLDLEKRTWKTIIRGGSFARYVPTGHIIYARNGSILAVPFNSESGEVTGAPVAVVSGVTMSPGSGAAKFAIARDAGTLVYCPGGSDEVRHELVWIDMAGKIEPVGAPVMPYSVAFPSPDGARIASTVFGASDSIFVYDIARRINTRITFSGNCSDPVWMEGGRTIAYISDADGPTAGYLINADGSGAPEKIAQQGVRGRHSSGMVDGKPAIAFEDNGDILLQPVRSESRHPLIATQFQESWPSVSGNGRWLSYASNETGQDAVYVRPLPSGESRWQVFTGGSTASVWAPDGSAIICSDPIAHRYFRVPFQESPRVEVGSPQLMFTVPPDIVLNLEPHPDGKRFLSARQLPARFTTDQVCVVLNWFEDLKAKVPGTPR